MFKFWTQYVWLWYSIIDPFWPLFSSCSSSTKWKFSIFLNIYPSKLLIFELFIYVFDVGIGRTSQTWNLAHTLHGYMFGVKILPQIIARMTYLLSIKSCPWEKCLVCTIFYPQSINTHLHIQVYLNLALLDQNYWWKRVQHCNKK